jgi:acetyl esterase/lipase
MTATRRPSAHASAAGSRFRGLLDPEIQPIVDLMAAAPGPPSELVPIAQVRAANDEEAALLSGPGEPVAAVRDVTAPGPGGPVPIRVYVPDEPGPLPLLAYAHGGGWVLGTITAFDTLCRTLANAAGAVVASIGYRLAPEHPFPAGLDDVLAATRWLGANAAALGADPARLAIGGDSAGGNLAAVAARRLRDAGGPALRYQLLVYPATDAGLNFPSYRENSEGFGLGVEDMRRYWELYLDGADGLAPDASPLRADDLAGLPPAYVLTVANDVLRDEGEAYAQALERAGVPVTVARYDGAVHGFFRWLAKAELSRRAVAEAGAALRAALA